MAHEVRRQAQVPAQAVEAARRVRVYKSLRFLEKRSTVPLIGVCIYEAVALTFPNKYVPPITVLANRYKWVFPVFCVGLGVHIWCYESAPNE